MDDILLVDFTCDFLDHENVHVEITNNSELFRLPQPQSTCDDTTTVPLLISKLSNRGELYRIAKQRYLYLRQRQELLEVSPVLALMYTETLYLLEDRIHSLSTLMTYLIPKYPNDIKLNRIAHTLQSEIQAAKDFDQNYYNCDDLLSEWEEGLEEMGVRLAQGTEDVGDEDVMCAPHITFYHRPVPCTGSAPSRPYVEEMSQRWQEMLTMTQLSHYQAIAAFGRLACIETNILEGIIEQKCLSRISQIRLIRDGFTLQAFEGERVRGRDPQEIIDILSTTEECLTKVITMNSPIGLSNEMIRDLHKTLLERDPFACFTIGESEEEEEGEEGLQTGDYQMYALLSYGEYRRRTVRTFNCIPDPITGKERVLHVVFCHHSEIDNEMNWFVSESNRILSPSEVRDNTSTNVMCNIDPMIQSCWIHAAFAYIHPFDDGNGRMTRLISSLPLLQIGLPPVIIFAANKEEYFVALSHFDQTGELDRLMNCVMNGFIEAVDMLKELHLGG